MSQNRDKDFIRKMKRYLKREGNKRKRQWLKEQLRVNPEDAHMDEYDFGDLSTEPLNGIDHDATRKKSHGRFQQDPNFESQNWHDYGEDG